MPCFLLTVLGFASFNPFPSSFPDCSLLLSSPFQPFSHFLVFSLQRAAISSIFSLHYLILPFLSHISFYQPQHILLFPYSFPDFSVFTLHAFPFLSQYFCTVLFPRTHSSLFNNPLQLSPFAFPPPSSYRPFISLCFLLFLSFPSLSPLSSFNNYSLHLLFLASFLIVFLSLLCCVSSLLLQCLAFLLPPTSLSVSLPSLCFSPFCQSLFLLRPLTYVTVCSRLSCASPSSHPSFPCNFLLHLNFSFSTQYSFLSVSSPVHVIQFCL